MLLSEAKEYLNDNGYILVDEATENEMTCTVTVSIQHNTTIVADERTKEGRAKYHRFKRAFGIQESTEDEVKLGSSKIGMFNKAAEKVDKSWTWMDFEAIKTYFAKEGIDVEEQHSQATVTKEVNDEPVSTGNFDEMGPYGEGSASCWYFTTISSRKWLFTLKGPKQAFESIDDLRDIFDEKINTDEWLPAYNDKTAEDYEINITEKYDI